MCMTTIYHCWSNLVVDPISLREMSKPSSSCEAWQALAPLLSSTLLPLPCSAQPPWPPGCWIYSYVLASSLWPGCFFCMKSLCRYPHGEYHHFLKSLMRCHLLIEPAILIAINCHAFFWFFLHFFFSFLYYSVCVLIAQNIWLFATQWIVACHASQFMEFSRQEYWSGLPFPSPGVFLIQGSNPSLLHCRQLPYHLSH